MPSKMKIPMADNTASAEANASRASKDVAPFLKQLRNMLNEEDASVIRWTPNGRAFEIVDMQLMMDVVLPKYFKHRKYTSFQRQLNYFNFRKWTKSKATVCTFSNEFFQRDQPELAWRITRKKSVNGPLHQQIKSNQDKSRAKILREMSPPSSPVPTTEQPQYWTQSSPTMANINVPSDDLHLKDSFPSPTDLDMMLHSHDHAASLRFAEMPSMQMPSYHHHAQYQTYSLPAPPSAESQAEQFEWIDALLPFVDRIEDDVYPFAYTAQSSHVHPIPRPYDYIAL